MFPRALRIARVHGIDIRVDPSWLIIAALIVLSFFQRFGTVGGHGTGVGVGMAVTATLLFFLSVLAHELAHALEGQHRGVKVEAITLFVFGGVTEMHLDTERPGDEFAIAAVGPWTSLVAAAVFGLVATAASVLDPAALAPVAEVAGVLGWLNVGLAAFNLIPGAPLDGGRVFRALVWAVTGDRHRSTRIAARAGQGVAALLLAAGAWLLFGRGAGLFNGIWLGILALFMWQAARAELRQAELLEVLGERTVGSLLATHVPRLAADRQLATVLDQVAGTPGVEVYPVVDELGRIVGVLHLDDVMAIDPYDRGFRNAGDVMRPLAELPRVDADEPVVDLLPRLADEPVVAVVDGDVDADAVLGVVTARQLGQTIERLRSLTRDTPRRPPVGTGP